VALHLLPQEEIAEAIVKYQVQDFQHLLLLAVAVEVAQ
jgi:hypothetical protein